jgi:hypothetical protein
MWVLFNFRKAYMPPFGTDEDFNHHIVRGLLRRQPGLDIVRIQDIGLIEAADPLILEWATQEKRILLTHDARTMPKHATERILAGNTIAGLLIVPQSLPIGKAIEDIITIALCSDIDEWINLIEYLPL